MRDLKRTLVNSVKLFLIRVGAWCSEETLYVMNQVANCIELGHWMSVEGFSPSNRVERREDLFRMVGAEVGERKCLYLEFGVAGGASMKYWSQVLKGPKCMLHGFDTFEGLPVDWNLRAKKGAFSTGGVLPDIPDPRVRLFKGLFEDTLPGYLVPDHEVLVINIDCDTYSSAAFVLKSFREYIRPGTYIYFDEFYDRANERKAFDEFLSSTGKRFRLLGCTKALFQVVFQCIA